MICILKMKNRITLSTFLSFILFYGFFLDPSTKCVHRFKCLNRFHLVTTLQILLYSYCMCNDNKDSLISDSLVRFKAFRPLRSSGTCLLRVPRIKTKQSKAAFSFYAPHLWNKLPEYLKSATTVSKCSF